MKRFKNFTKVLSVVLAMIVFLSSFSVAVSAANYEKVTVTPNDTPYSVNEGNSAEEDTASPDNAPYIVWSTDGKKSVYATGADETFHMYHNTSQGIRFNKIPFSFVNQIDGTSKTYPGNWGAWEYEYAKSNSTGKTTPVWCIRPAVRIAGATYYDGDSSSSAKAYMNSLNSNGKKALRNAMAATVAFGKYRKATENNEYYYAVGDLLWDFIAGFRDPVTFNKKSGATTFLERAYCTKGSSFYNKIVNARDEILSRMKKIESPLTDAVFTKKAKLYESISTAAKNAQKNNDESKALKLKPNKKNNPTKWSNTFDLKEIANDDSFKYEVVNQDGESGAVAKTISVNYSNTKKQFSVSTTTDLSTKSNTYFIKITREITDYVKSSKDNFYQDIYGDKQTMLNSLQFSIPTQTAYIPLFVKPVDDEPKFGSLHIKKVITTNIDGVDYNGDLSGWYFEVENKATGKKTTLVTDEDGVTPTMNKIEIVSGGTKLTITELGRKSGSSYVMPNDFTDKKGNTKHEYTITLTENTEEDLEVEWENQCDIEMPVVIKKDVTDNGPIDGYYFLVFGNRELVSGNIYHEPAIETPTIVGPTDKNGEIEFYLDNTKNIINNSTLYVVELGRLKAGQSTSFDRKVPTSEVAKGAYRDRFEIPSQYTPPYNSMMDRLFGIPDAFPVIFSKTDIQNFFDEPYTFKKSIYVTNVTEGYITVYKSDSVTHSPMENVVYEVYDRGMNEDEEGDTQEPVATIVTDANGYGQSKLIPTGEYYIVETRTDSKHHLDRKRYTITVQPGANNLANAPKHIATNEPTRVTLNKKESSTLSSNGSYVPGCVMQLFEKPSSGSLNYDTAKPILEYTTTNSARSLIGVLELEKTYILHEKSCPEGYCLADDVEFEVNDTPGVPTNVEMLDKTTKIEVAKIDGLTNKYMPGVPLQLQDSSGNPVTVKDYDGESVTQWVTRDKPLTIEGILKRGETYKLVELVTMPGYTRAASKSFVVRGDGELQTITMTNIPTKVQINKFDSVTNTYMAGVTLQIQDSAGKAITVKDYDGKYVTSWVSKAEPLTITGILESGKTYKLVELETKPGYTLADPVSFTVRTDGQLQPVKMENKPTKVRFPKLAGDTNKQLPGCVMSLTDSSGKEIRRWTTTNEAYYLEGVLIAGETYTLTEVSAAEGYMKAKPITFTVNNDGKEQVITMVDLKYARPDLPKTGGNGVLPFMAIGIGAFFAAAITFVIRRRGKKSSS